MLVRSSLVLGSVVRGLSFASWSWWFVVVGPLVCLPCLARWLGSWSFVGSWLGGSFVRWLVGSVVVCLGRVGLLQVLVRFEF